MSQFRNSAGVFVDPGQQPRPDRPQGHGTRFNLRMLRQASCWLEITAVFTAAIALVLQYGAQFVPPSVAGPHVAGLEAASPESWLLLAAPLLASVTMRARGPAEQRDWKLPVALLLLTLAVLALSLATGGPLAGAAVAAAPWLALPLACFVATRIGMLVVSRLPWTADVLADRIVVVAPSATLRAAQEQAARLYGPDGHVVAQVATDLDAGRSDLAARDVVDLHGMRRLAATVAAVSADRVCLYHVPAGIERAALEVLRGVAVAIDSVGDDPAAQPVHLATPPLDGWRGVVKTIEDYALSLLALPILLPVFAVIATLIKLDSPGPVFFRQPRDGFNNRPIVVYKFRTMRNDACDASGAAQTRRSDPRVTRVGRFLRATSLDELPQVFNVLRGEMSWVGPRPLPVGMLTQGQANQAIDSRYVERHLVRPGITGLAQVQGLRGAVSTPEALRRRIDLDLAYMRNWSLRRDVAIVALTAVTMLLHKDAF